MDEILDVLQSSGGLNTNDFMVERTVPRLEPKFAAQESMNSLNPALAGKLRNSGISKLYDHQARAVDLANEGKNIVLEAPTASGKTLAFGIPVLESLMQSSNEHALFIYPMKAVAADQLKQLQQMCDGLTDQGGREIRAATYDGDTSNQRRAAIRNDPPHILLTNIEMIHLSFLGSNESWQSVLWNLKWIVIDEIHMYRGYFGTNSSIVLRRLGHLLASLGIEPQFAMASATCANPEEHASNLTGRKFHSISASAQMRPERRYVFIHPEGEGQRRYWTSLRRRAVKSSIGLARAGKTCLVFCPTREFAEKSYVDAVKEASELDADVSRTLEKSQIAVFKSGINARTRRKILEDLSAGNVKVVYSTNALEVGIDVAGLDVVMMIGFPDNVMRARQQLGRAGRNWRGEGTVVFYPRNAPLDSFYVRNLDAFLDNPVDELVIYPENHEISQRHAASLLHETDGLLDVPNSPLGKSIKESASEMVSQGRRIRHRRGRYWPHQRVPIRGISGESHELMCGDESLGTMSSYEKFKHGYLDAIYLQSGEKFRVVGHRTAAADADGMSDNVIELERENEPVSTIPHVRQDVSPRDNYGGLSWEFGEDYLELFYGVVRVNEWIDNVELVDDSSEKVLDTWQPTQSSWNSTGHSMWFHLPESSRDAVGLYSLEQIVRVGVRFVIPADEHDVTTYSGVWDNSVYLVETYPGGIGIAKKAYERWREVLDAGVKIASDCRCRTSCPYCLVPPRKTSDIDKNKGIELAWLLLSIGNNPENSRYDTNIDGWKSVN